MTARLDDALIARLATEPGLFHRGPSGERLPMGLTEAPLRVLHASIERGMRTLETGCGGTTVVFAAAAARHTAVTPSRAEEQRVRELCEREGIPLDTVDFRIGSSDRVLVEWSEPLDIVLIDGAHRFPLPMIDWHYVAPWLKVGGELWVDDIPIPAVYRLFEFLCGEPEWELVQMHGDKVAQFRKASEPANDPIHDWALQRYNDKWIFSHIPLRRRWRTWRDRAMIGTRVRRLLGRG